MKAPLTAALLVLVTMASSSAVADDPQPQDAYLIIQAVVDQAHNLEPIRDAVLGAAQACLQGDASACEALVQTLQDFRCIKDGNVTDVGGCTGWLVDLCNDPATWVPGLMPSYTAMYSGQVGLGVTKPNPDGQPPPLLRTGTFGLFGPVFALGQVNCQ